jgi:regulator of protease activity HflC (stomatin/prohibitin superfamily)
MRGVRESELEPGTYYVNPYQKRISLVDCRSQRINLAEERDLGFPSKDGFWVSLDGIVEFRIKPEKAAEVFVTYNEDVNGDRIDEEIRNKIILPNARSFCRLQGSDSLGRDFIQGLTRTKFQESFQAEMRTACDPLGIEIIQALITRINPPEKIAKPVRAREIAKQEQKQYLQETLQQQSEQDLAVQKALVERKQAVVKADQEVVKLTVEASQKQTVAVTKADELLAVAKIKLLAAKDEAAAVRSRGKAAAEVVKLENVAQAAGWKEAVAAFQGDGHRYARYVLLEKMAPAYRQIMANTADSPIMDIFKSFEPQPETRGPQKTSAVKEKQR